MDKKTPPNKTCFVIMPITTPPDQVGRYSGGAEHFTHVFKYLFTPAIEKAGYTAIGPKSKGTELIEAKIIKNLDSADLVLCDLSASNANVYFELGIRTALNKPVCLVKDEKLPSIPFDVIGLNCCDYSSSMHLWESSNIDALAEHIHSTPEENQLWKHFSIGAAASSLPSPKGSEKIDYIISQINNINEQVRQLKRTGQHATPPASFNIADYVHRQIIRPAAKTFHIIIDRSSFNRDRGLYKIEIISSSSDDVGKFASHISALMGAVDFDILQKENKYEVFILRPSIFLDDWAPEQKTP